MNFLVRAEESKLNQVFNNDELVEHIYLVISQDLSPDVCGIRIV